jgi:hypothetical protein
MKASDLIRLTAVAVAMSSMVLLSACGSFGSKPPPSPPAKAIAELPELMAQGAAAETDGLKVAALRRYEEAAQLYPTSKQPWLRIAHIQFDSGNYGEAIVAAQQVVSRDDTDKVARSILSVSGLRVAAKAVADLSKNRALVGSVRTEAQELASVLRESLGENVLVPAQVPVAPARPRPVASSAPSGTAATAPAGSAARRPVAPEAASTGSGSPFSSLK